jgi:hypothetical protein
MTPLDLTRDALASLGDAATIDQVVTYARERHGARLDPRFVPLYRATIQGEEQRRRAREAAARILDQERRGRDG